MKTQDLWKCDECGWVGDISKVLSAPNPFEIDETVDGCPRCAAINRMLHMCEVKGCKILSASGINTKYGYLCCCGDHMKMYRLKDKNETT